jgi:CHAT domain-containing protein
MKQFPSKRLAGWRQLAWHMPLLAGLTLGAGAWAQNAPATPDDESSPANNQALQALNRQRASDSTAGRAAEGRALLARDTIVLDGYSYCGQAMGLAESGDFRQSIRASSKALYLGQRDNKPDLQALALRDLALAYLYAGQIDQAEQHARAALAIPQANPQQVLAPANKVIGDVLAKRGDLAGAQAAYQAAQTTASPKYLPQVQASLANVLVNAGQAKAALVQLNAIAPVAAAELGSFYLRTKARAYMADQQPEPALALYEQIAKEDHTPDAEYQRLWAVVGVARVQLARNQRPEALASFIQATTLATALAPKFRSEEVRTGLFGDLQSVYDDALRLAVEQKDFATAWVLSEASRSRQLVDALRDRADDALSGQTSLAELQGRLRPDEGVLEFHAVDDQLVIWVIRKTSFTARVLPVAEADLGVEVDGFRRSIIERRRDVNTRGQALYNKLIAGSDLGDTKRLFVVPHGPLHYMPFQALYDGKGYLIERVSVAVWPSASVGSLLWARPQRNINTLVAFGNPSTTENVPLPGAEREVAEVAALFKDKQVYIQHDATKPTFKQKANQSAVLHVAAHAEVDEVDPLFSRILLASDGSERGLLEAREVYGLNLKDVSLVTLSACESGLGKVLNGDEIVGFTRSFLSAGVSSLVASLWPVADDATEALMSTMYSSMNQGADLMDAMRTAQLDVQKRRRFAHPFFWAPFNVIGNGRMQLGS